MFVWKQDTTKINPHLNTDNTVNCNAKNCGVYTRLFQASPNVKWSCLVKNLGSSPKGTLYQNPTKLVGQNPPHLVNIKIGGKQLFIPKNLEIGYAGMPPNGGMLIAKIMIKPWDFLGCHFQTHIFKPNLRLCHHIPRKYPIHRWFSYDFPIEIHTDLERLVDARARSVGMDLQRGETWRNRTYKLPQKGERDLEQLKSIWAKKKT